MGIAIVAAHRIALDRTAAVVAVRSVDSSIAAHLIDRFVAVVLVDSPADRDRRAVDRVANSGFDRLVVVPVVAMVDSTDRVADMLEVAVPDSSC